MPRQPWILSATSTSKQNVCQGIYFLSIYFFIVCFPSTAFVKLELQEVTRRRPNRADQADCGCLRNYCQCCLPGSGLPFALRSAMNCRKVPGAQVPRAVVAPLSLRKYSCCWPGHYTRPCSQGQTSSR